MWFALFSIIFYILSLLLIAPFLMNSSEGKLSQSKIPFFLTALTAIILHAVSTFPLLEDLASGQSFTLMQIASLMSVIIAALATLSMFLVSTMWFVLPIVYAFSIISLIFATFLSSHIIQMLNQNTLMLFHIGLFGKVQNGTYILFPFTTVKMVTQLLFVAAIFVHIFINIRPLLVSLGIISYKERRSDIYLILSVLLLFIAGAVILYYIGWQYL